MDPELTKLQKEAEQQANDYEAIAKELYKLLEDYRRVYGMKYDMTYYQSTFGKEIEDKAYQAIWKYKNILK